MKVCECCATEISTKDGDNRCVGCEDKPKPKARKQRAKTDDLMASLGLTKVRGALGGVYYE
jgi:hypothetical protein